MRYAEADDLTHWGAFYGVVLPTDRAARETLLDLATADLVRYLGKAWDLSLLDADVAHSLSNATCVQACFRAGQGPDAMLALEDGITTVGPLAISSRPAARVSVEAVELVTGLGLYARSGTVDAA